MTCVVSDGHTSRFCQICVKQVLKVLKKCLMHTNQHGNIHFVHFYKVFFQSFKVKFVMFEILGAKVYPCNIEIRSVIKGFQCMFEVI